MPSRSAHSPRTVPGRLAFLAFLPEHEIQRVFFLVVDVHAGAGHHFIRVSSGQSAVGGKFGNRKKHVSVHRVGNSFFLESPDQIDHILHVPRGSRRDRRRQDVEGGHIFIVQRNIALGDLGNADAFPIRPINDFIVNVGEIFHIPHVVAARFQMAEDDIKHNRRAGVADVADIIRRNAANVHSDRAFPNRLKDFLFSCLRIIDFLGHFLTFVRDTAGASRDRCLRAVRRPDSYSARPGRRRP